MTETNKSNALYTFCVEIQFGAKDMKEARQYIRKLLKQQNDKIGYFRRVKI